MTTYETRIHKRETKLFKNDTEETLTEFYDKYKKKQGVCGSINGVKAMELAHKYPSKKIKLAGYNLCEKGGKPLRHIVIIYNNKIIDMSNMGYGGEPLIMSYMDFLSRIHKKIGQYPLIMDVEPVYSYEKNRDKIMACDERYNTHLKYTINCGIDMGNTLLQKMLDMEAVEGKCWVNTVEEYMKSGEIQKLEKLEIKLD
tara:strand:- start:1287 stop:1883 length:597 start_codon:yes stop_codon:yes gene_type:complete